MLPNAEKQLIAKKLQAQINALQGLGKQSCNDVDGSFKPFASAFPGRVFPIGAVHEFVSYESPESAATNAFITALAGKLIKKGGLCLWVGNSKIFTPGLKYFGLEPDRIVFINASKHKEALWILEEALKCEALTAVIGEIKELSFTESRRLQLAVERSGVTGFVHRYQPFAENAVACAARWKVVPQISLSENGLPGVGSYCWNVQLLKVRNGKSRSWQIGWLDKSFVTISNENISIELTHKRHVG